jgi:2-octaprenyl-6-methoxyphenol hydroxylase
MSDIIHGMTNENDYDILIVGGGLTGLALGCAIRHLPLRIGIIDATTHISDNRSIALSRGSQQFFEQQKLWSMLADAAACIKQVHVSDKGHFGMTRFTAEESRVPALGYVIPYKNLQNTLSQTLTIQGSMRASINWICPATVQSMSPSENGWALTVNTGQTYTAQLIIAADGANSTIRKLQEIPVIEQYAGQTAIIANVHITRPHKHIAYERFTSKGAIALLPIDEKTYALIWTVPTEEAASYLALETKTFLSKLQHEFGYRLGRFTDATPRYSHVLKQCYAEQQIKPGIVLLGNAAHTLHPIAAQGFNLGLRDIDCLAKMIEQALNRHQSLGELKILEKYVNQRIGDQKKLMQFTNGLVRLFSHPSSIVRIPCNLGLLALNFPSPLKKAACRYAMGV